MPFTPSHAVVALPFVRTPLLPAAIAVGAMTPDLPLFLRGTPLTYETTHTNVLVTMLIAIALLVGWYWLLRPAVRELSPFTLARRLPVAWDATGLDVLPTIQAPRRGAMNPVWRHGLVFAVLVAISIFIGVVSHIVWDAFTHEGRWGVEVFPALNEAWGPLLGYKWLQHGSSVVGLAILAVWCLLRLRRADAAATMDRVLPAGVRWAWWVSLPVILVGAWLVGLALWGPLTAEYTVAHLAYRVLPPACALWGALTVILAIVVLAARVRQRGSQTGSSRPHARGGSKVVGPPS